jgi:16S rRNA (guanine527-N7)-methyltransferase
VDTAVIEQLLRPFVALEEGQFASISTYIDLLLKWNARINLTAVRHPEEIVTRHFGESFFAAKLLLPPEHRGTVVDLGSGAGFPGLPLAMIAPTAQVTLIESNHRKAAFLNEVIFALGLKNAKVFSQRAEMYTGRADLVMMRAVERFEKALATAISLVGPLGRVALMIGTSQADRTRALPSDVSWKDPMRVPGGHSRVLLVGVRDAGETRAVIVE